MLIMVYLISRGWPTVLSLSHRERNEYQEFSVCKSYQKYTEKAALIFLHDNLFCTKAFVFFYSVFILFFLGERLLLVSFFL